MLIQISYPDGRNDYVKDFILDRLIENKQIVKFRRCTGWVTLGIDQLRQKQRLSTFKTPNEIVKSSR